MIRLNRGRVIGILLTGFIVYFLFLSSTNSNSDFRRRTEEGLARRHGLAQGDLSDEAYRQQTNQKLHDILAQKEQQPLRASDEREQPAPAKAAPVADSEVTGVAGRKTMQKPKEKQRQPTAQLDEKQKNIKKPTSDEEDDDEDDKKSKKPKGSEDTAEDIARAKLQEYLKKPLIIFSKSYCPHSKRAKHLLLNLYKINPAPLVVELDQLTTPLPKPHSANGDEDDDNNNSPAPTLGLTLQGLLAEMTGRRTVPNIVVGKTSIGGNDLLWEMHEEGTLAARIRELGGKRIISVEALDEEGGHDGAKEKRHGGET